MDSNSHNVIIEAVLELIIRATKKICNGTSPDKVSKHWKLLQVFHRIYSHLQTLKTVRLVHVKRKVNMLVDPLANEGVTNRDRESRYVWDLLPLGKLWEDCLYEVTWDMELWTNRTDRRDLEDVWEDEEPHIV